MRIWAVIHYLNDNQAMRNAQRAYLGGCDGVMLIEMGGRDHEPVFVAGAIKRRFPDLRVGLNFLRASSARQMPLGQVDSLDATWTDRQLTHSSGSSWADAEAAASLLRSRNDHELFCGVAFKYQDHEPDPVVSAYKARSLGFIPTTSGPGTGEAADPKLVQQIRDGIGHGSPLAIASGITPQNVSQFAPHVTDILVSTGISSTFHELSDILIEDLIRKIGR